MKQHDARVGAFRDEKRAQRRRAVTRRPGEQFPPHLRQRDALVRGERGDYVVRVASLASLGRIRRRARVSRRRRARANDFNAEPSARRAGKRARETLSTKRFVGGDECSAAAASSRAAADTPEAREARDADDVVAALAAHEGVSLAEMGRKLLAGSTADRAALLRAFLVAKRADTGVMLFH